MYYDEQFKTELKLIYNPDIDVRDKRHFVLNMIAIELKNIANELHEVVSELHESNVALKKSVPTSMTMDGNGIVVHYGQEEEE